MLIVSAAFFGVGLAATAGADRLWVAYLTYGVGVGVGVGCVYAPMHCHGRRLVRAPARAGARGAGLRHRARHPRGRTARRMAYRRLRVAYHLPDLRGRGEPVLLVLCALLISAPRPREVPVGPGRAMP